MNKKIVHFEIPADEIERLKTFYEKLRALSDKKIRFPYS